VNYADRTVRQAKRLRCAIFHIGRGYSSGAVRAAEEMTADFNAVADHPAFAMLTKGSHSLDRAFEAVKGMTHARCNQIKTFVVVIATDFAFRHNELLQICQRQSK
jgi:L-aminopeptidase/D-esterase-like protein